jgi:hypothetical protein
MTKWIKFLQEVNRVIAVIDMVAVASLGCVIGFAYLMDFIYWIVYRGKHTDSKR